MLTYLDGHKWRPLPVFMDDGVELRLSFPLAMALGARRAAEYVKRVDILRLDLGGVLTHASNLTWTTTFGAIDQSNLEPMLRPLLQRLMVHHVLNTGHGAKATDNPVLKTAWKNKCCTPEQVKQLEDLGYSHLVPPIFSFAGYHPHPIIPVTGIREPIDLSGV